MAKGKIDEFSGGSDHPFAIADLTDAYKQNGAFRVRRGVKLVDRRALLICDELALSYPSEVWWFMHTQADVVLADDGRSATLRRGGRQVSVSLLDAPDGAKLSVMAAERLPSSPESTPGERGAQGHSKLVVNLASITEARFAVAIIPEGGPRISRSDLSPLSAWSS
jgi:hypothetical protein